MIFPIPLPVLRLYLPGGDDLPPPVAPALPHSGLTIMTTDPCLSVLLHGHSYPLDPCRCLPGTRGKQETMTARRRLVLPLCREDDTQLGKREGYQGTAMEGEGQPLRLVHEGPGGRLERQRRAA